MLVLSDRIKFSICKSDFETLKSSLEGIESERRSCNKFFLNGLWFLGNNIWLAGHLIVKMLVRILGKIILGRHSDVQASETSISDFQWHTVYSQASDMLICCVLDRGMATSLGELRMRITNLLSWIYRAIISCINLQSKHRGSIQF